MAMVEPDYYLCPQCGSEVRVGGAGCPKCARPPKRRERKPWEQDAAHDGLDLPDEPEDFDYQGFVEDEFGGGKRPRSFRDRVYWIAGVLLLAALLFLWVLGG